MLPVLAFSSRGFLSGILMAFSSDHLARLIVPLVFALFGGSLVTFGTKISSEQRNTAYLSLLSISASCAVGIIVGVLCVQYRWLNRRAEIQLGAVNSSREQLEDAAGAYSSEKYSIEKSRYFVSVKCPADRACVSSKLEKNTPNGWKMWDEERTNKSQIWPWFFADLDSAVRMASAVNHLIRLRDGPMTRTDLFTQ